MTTLCMFVISVPNSNKKDDDEKENKEIGEDPIIPPIIRLMGEESTYLEVAHKSDSIEKELDKNSKHEKIYFNNPSEDPILVSKNTKNVTHDAHKEIISADLIMTTIDEEHAMLGSRNNSAISNIDETIQHKKTNSLPDESKNKCKAGELTEERIIFLKETETPNENTNTNDQNSEKIIEKKTTEDIPLEEKIDKGHAKEKSLQEENAEALTKRKTEAITSFATAVQHATDNAWARQPDEMIKIELEYLNIDYTKQVTENNARVIFQFLYENSKSEILLSKFMQYGIGKIKGTNINILSPVVSNVGNKEQITEIKDTENNVPLEIQVDRKKMDDEDDTKINSFLASMKSRLMVRQVYKNVENKGKFTFDFVSFLICAAIIAAIGLASNSSVAVVASMLISPVMGPILLLTFGLRLKKRYAIGTGFVNMLLGLAIILLTGFVLVFPLFGILLKVDIKEFPSKEMVDRSLNSNLVLGIFVAFASSYGVCVSVLQGDHSANIGVAISASLLPPVVNAGMLFGYAILLAAIPAVPIRVSDLQNLPMILPPNCSFMHLNSITYTPMYSCNMPLDMTLMGLKSLLLCFLNIVIIIIGGDLWLKLKEVAPETTIKNKAIKHFFKYDIKEARKYYEQLKTKDKSKMLQKIYEEYAQLRNPKTDADTEETKEEFSVIENAMVQNDDYRMISQQLNEPTTSTFATTIQRKNAKRNSCFDDATVTRSFKTQKMLRRVSNFNYNSEQYFASNKKKCGNHQKQNEHQEIGRFKVQIQQQAKSVDLNNV